LKEQDRWWNHYAAFGLNLVSSSQPLVLVFMDLLGSAVLTLVAFAAGFLTRANISRRRRAAARRIRGDA
jgi:hypothetical protein